MPIQDVRQACQMLSLNDEELHMRHGKPAVLEVRVEAGAQGGVGLQGGPEVRRAGPQQRREVVADQGHDLLGRRVAAVTRRVLGQERQEAARRLRAEAMYTKL